MREVTVVWIGEKPEKPQPATAITWCEREAERGKKGAEIVAADLAELSWLGKPQPKASGEKDCLYDVRVVVAAGAKPAPRKAAPKSDVWRRRDVEVAHLTRHLSNRKPEAAMAFRLRTDARSVTTATRRLPTRNSAPWARYVCLALAGDPKSRSEEKEVAMKYAARTSKPRYNAARVGMGEAHLALGAPTRAAAVLDRALKLQEQAPSAAELSRIRFALAQALWPSFASRRRAVQLAESAREGFARARRSEDAQRVEAWLAVKAR